MEVSKQGGHGSCRMRELVETPDGQRHEAHGRRFTLSTGLSTPTPERMHRGMNFFLPEIGAERGSWLRSRMNGATVTGSGERDWMETEFPAV